MIYESERHDTERAMAEQLVRKGKMTLEEIADCVSALSLDELKEIEDEVMQLDIKKWRITNGRKFKISARV